LNAGSVPPVHTYTVRAADTEEGDNIIRTIKATVVTACAVGIMASSGVASVAATGPAPSIGSGNGLDKQAADAPRRVALLDGDYPGMATTTNPNAEGRVRLTLLKDDSKICYRVRVSGMTTRAVYIYRRSNDVLKTRLYDEAHTDADVIKACVTEVPAELLSAYQAHSKRFYVQASSYDGADEIGGTLRRPR